MSDITIGTHPGQLSPRNIDTIEYVVMKELPYPTLPKPGERLAFWPRGETFANINGGLRSVKNEEVADWEKAGMIERVGKAAAAPKPRDTMLTAEERAAFDG